MRLSMQSDCVSNRILIKIPLDTDCQLHAEPPFSEFGTPGALLNYDRVLSTAYTQETKKKEPPFSESSDNGAHDPGVGLPRKTKA